MKGFSKRPAKRITLTRGEESIELELHALPPGWAAKVRSEFKPPIENHSGTITKQHSDPEWNDLFGMLVIAKCLEPSGVLTTKLDSKRWRATAEAVRTEFVEAGLTDGDLKTIANAMQGLNNLSEVKEARKN